MYIYYELEKIEPPVNMSPYRDIYRHTDDIYVEDRCNGRCVRCKWCSPDRENNPWSYSHLITITGHFVSRLGYCYCKGHDIPFDKHDGCKHYRCETERKIIHEETMTYEQQDKFMDSADEIGSVKALEKLRFGNLFDVNS